MCEDSAVFGYFEYENILNFVFDKINDSISPSGFIPNDLGQFGILLSLDLHYNNLQGNIICLCCSSSEVLVMSLVYEMLT